MYMGTVLAFSRYWPTAAVRVPPFVDVLAMRVVDGPGVLPFEVVGMDVLGLGASPLNRAVHLLSMCFPTS
jgi:hypothetical protein